MIPFKASRPVFIVPALLCASWLLAGCGGSSAPVPVIVTGPAYVLTDISNGHYDGAVAIDNRGQTLVTTRGANLTPIQFASFLIYRSARGPAVSRDSVPSYAFLYSGGKFTTLNIGATNFNDAGVFVGAGEVGSLASLQNGTAVQIPALGPAATALNFTTYPYAINSIGQVVGTSFVPIDPNAPDAGSRVQVSHAFLYANGQTADLGTLSEPSFAVLPSDMGGAQSSPLLYSSSAAYAINNQGQVVGVSGTALPVGGTTIVEHAFLYSGGKMSDLGTLGGPDSLATSINNNGQAVGYAELNGTSVTHAALWQNGQVQDLGAPQAYNSYALSINDAGQIVGTASLIPNGETSASQAFVYREGKMFDLNNQVTNISGWKLNAATGINNQGQICGYGLYKGQTRAFLLTPK